MPEAATPDMTMTFFTYVKTRATHITALVLLSVAMAFVFCPSCLTSPSRFAIVALYGSMMWIFLWLGNEYITIWLDDKIPWTKAPNRRFIVGAVAVIVYSVVAAFLIATIFETGFNLQASGVGQVYWTVILAVGITLFMTSRSFLLNWRKSAIDAERLQKEGIAARYEILKSQVNPHFLFNSLNALTNLVYEDQQKAVQFIKQLSQVYRYVLDTRDQEIIPVGEELEFLRSYVFLQRIRFGDKLRIDIKIADADIYVTPLALQMLIENAIKHNVVSEESPLVIKVYEEDGYISVENNLHRKTNPLESTSGIGLDNIMKRYSILSDRKVDVVETATRFTVRLPRLKRATS